MTDDELDPIEIDQRFEEVELRVAALERIMLDLSAKLSTWAKSPDAWWNEESPAPDEE